MRLLHYYPRALVGDGGPTRAMWEWAGAAHRAGCDVAVAYDRDLEGPTPLRATGVPIIPLPHTGAGVARLPRRLADVLAPDDVLVLHPTYVPGNVWAARRALRRGVPYVVVPHGGYNRRARERRAQRKRMWLPIERAYLERALAVHVFFETEVADAADVAPKARWVVAPTGFDVPSGRWDGGSGGYLAWIGRYDICTKGLDLIIEAMSSLPPADRWPLRLHGKRSEDSAADIESLAAACGVSNTVTVGGQLTGSAKADFLQRAVAYVHPSRWESHSLAIVEALAYGIPSVVSARCSIARALRAAEAAVIVEPTPEAIAHGVSTILRSPQRYSDRAAEFVRTALSWEVIMKDYLRQMHCVSAGGGCSRADA